MIGEVDAVYDRGALEAINVGDRQAYVKLMGKLVGKSFRWDFCRRVLWLKETFISVHFRYVLNAYEYDDSEFQGPPRNLPRDEVFNLFGKLSILKPFHINIPILQRFVFSAENEIVEVLEEADFSDYGREKYNLSVPMLKVIYEIKPSKM